MSESRMKISARHLGACKAGQKPGDSTCRCPAWGISTSTNLIRACRGCRPRNETPSGPDDRDDADRLPVRHAQCGTRIRQLQRRTHSRRGTAAHARPDKPNCVSTEAIDPDRKIAPITVNGDLTSIRERLLAAIALQSGSRIAIASEGFIVATFRSRLFGFIDEAQFR